MNKLKAAITNIHQKAMVTRKRTRTGEDRDVVLLLEGVVVAMEVLEMWGKNK